MRRTLHSQLKHANIVTLHDIIHTTQTLTFVFEYLKQDLKQYMDDAGGILVSIHRCRPSVLYLVLIPPPGLHRTCTTYACSSFNSCAAWPIATGVYRPVPRNGPLPLC